MAEFHQAMECLAHGVLKLAGDTKHPQLLVLGDFGMLGAAHSGRDPYQLINDLKHIGDDPLVNAMRDAIRFAESLATLMRS